MWSRPAQLLLVTSAFALATLAVPAQADDNLRTCLDGSYPSLCDKSRLTPSQRVQAEAAERRANLETCLDGNYPSLCNHGLLTSEEAVQVRTAEHRENLRTCLTGLYKSLCDHSVLSADEAAQVEEAERTENRRVCLTGLYPSLCDQELLSEEDRPRAEAAVKAQDQRVEQPLGPSARQDRVPPPTLSQSGPVESFIVSDFDGLEYGNLYELANGQVWQQSEAWIWIWIWIYPQVVIWDDGGVYRMKVEGIDHAVVVRRVN